MKLLRSKLGIVLILEVCKLDLLKEQQVIQKECRYILLNLGS